MSLKQRIAKLEDDFEDVSDSEKGESDEDDKVPNS